MDPSERIEFSPVKAAGHHIHCYLDHFYIARISMHGDHCSIDGPGFAPCHAVPNEDQAREVVRMWIRRRAYG